jgi:hypothetical protein
MIMLTSSSSLVELVVGPLHRAAHRWRTGAPREVAAIEMVDTLQRSHGGRGGAARAEALLLTQADAHGIDIDTLKKRIRALRQKRARRQSI